jgi:hypothetical protein
VPQELLFDTVFNIHRILRKGGHLLISTPLTRPRLDTDSRAASGRLFNSVTPENLQFLFEKVGFRQIIRWDTEDSLGLPWTNPHANRRDCFWRAGYSRQELLRMRCTLWWTHSTASKFCSHGTAGTWHRFFDNLKKWEAEHPHIGPVVRNAEELRQLIAEKERQRAEQPAPTLSEEPPKPEKR